MHPRYKETLLLVGHSLRSCYIIGFSTYLNLNKYSNLKYLNMKVLGLLRKPHRRDHHYYRNINFTVVWVTSCHLY